MKKFMKLKKNQKGFTLVEIIVVLVILAILAAAAIPATTKYIDEAKQKADISSARSCYTAAVALAGEDYANNATTLTCTDSAKVLERAGISSEDYNVVVTMGTEAGKTYEVQSVQLNNTKSNKSITISQDGTVVYGEVE